MTAAIYKQGVTINLINDGAPHRPVTIKAQWKDGRGSVLLIHNDSALRVDTVDRLRDMADAVRMTLGYCQRVHACTLPGLEGAL